MGTALVVNDDPRFNPGCVATSVGCGDTDGGRVIVASAFTWSTDTGGPWPPTSDALAAAIALLPTLDDDVTRNVVEALAEGLIDERERAAATRNALCVALRLLGQSERECRRFRARVHELLDAQREVVARGR